MNKDNKYKKLALSIALDAVGSMSYLVPGAAEFMDVAWAPASAYLMTKLYKGNTGKIAAAISFIEEAMPGTDIIPTFTLMWMYTYVFTGVKDETSENIDDMKSVKRTIEV